MDFLLLVGTLAGMGLIGGLVNCLITGEFQLPRYDKKAKKLHVGSLGTILLGGVVSAVIWGIYGSRFLRLVRK